MSVGIIIFLILFLALAVWRLNWAVLFIIFALPSYLIRFQILGLPSTILEAMILIAFAVWCLRDFLPGLKNAFRSGAKRQPYPFGWEIILVLLVSFLAVGVAGFSLSALGIWRAYFLEPILLFILIFNCCKGREGREKILWALLLAAAAISLFAVFQKITGLGIANPFWQAAATRRVTSFFPYPNAVGLFLGPLILIFAGWLWSLPWPGEKNAAGKKITIILTLALSILAIYFAKSWGAIVALGVAGLFFLVLAGKKSRLAALVIVVLGALAFMSFSPLRQAAAEKIGLESLSGQIRRQQWQETLVMLNHGHFWLGAGLANFQAAVAPYHQAGLFFNRDHLANFDAQLRASAELRARYWQPVEIYLYPHNILLNFWSELGLAGALLFAWLIGKYLFLSGRLARLSSRAGRTEKYLAIGWLTAMVTFVVHGLVDVPYFKNDLAALFWLLLAFLGALNLSYRRGREPKD